jgi:hypothetical protein
MALGETGIAVARRQWTAAAAAAGTALAVATVSTLAILSRQLSMVVLSWVVAVMGAVLLLIADCEAVALLLVFLVYTLLPLELWPSLFAALGISFSATIANVFVRRPLSIIQVVSAFF